MLGFEPANVDSVDYIRGCYQKILDKMSEIFQKQLDYGMVSGIKLKKYTVQLSRDLWLRISFV